MSPIKRIKNVWPWELTIYLFSIRRLHLIYVAVNLAYPEAINPFTAASSATAASANDNSHTTSNGGSKNGKKRAGGQPYLD